MDQHQGHPGKEQLKLAALLPTDDQLEHINSDVDAEFNPPASQIMAGLTNSHTNIQGNNNGVTDESAAISSYDRIYGYEVQASQSSAEMPISNQRHTAATNQSTINQLSQRYERHAQPYSPFFEPDYPLNETRFLTEEMPFASSFAHHQSPTRKRSSPQRRPSNIAPLFQAESPRQSIHFYPYKKILPSLSVSEPTLGNTQNQTVPSVRHFASQAAASQGGIPSPTEYIRYASNLNVTNPSFNNDLSPGPFASAPSETIDKFANHEVEILLKPTNIPAKNEVQRNPFVAALSKTKKKSRKPQVNVMPKPKKVQANNQAQMQPFTAAQQKLSRISHLITYPADSTTDDRDKPPPKRFLTIPQAIALVNNPMLVPRNQQRKSVMHLNVAFNSFQLARYRYYHRYNVPSEAEIIASIPENASSVFHIWDRRIDMDSLKGEEHTTPYSLLRSWVRDDPYRREMKCGIGGINASENNVLSKRKTEGPTCVTENDIRELEKLEDMDRECRPTEQAYNKKRKSTFCNILDNGVIGKSGFPDMNRYLKGYIEIGARKRMIRNRLIKKQDEICLKRLEKRIGLKIKTDKNKK